ncbi:MAG: imidazole glycerol phosphate synthase subunit HisH [Elusimicrobia bacterium]|nr:imidazole glycerol phosphate synthase subunit HisH [Elusimicrobiota bacterium]
MSETRVAVVDYGRGNLYSIEGALRKLGCDVQVTSDPAAIEAAPRLILPGVGAFGDGMEGLRQRGLIEPLKRFRASGRPLLGICLGMQLLLEEGSEFGRHEGLGLIPGRVVRFASAGDFKIPHVGWNRLKPAADWAGTPLGGLPAGSFMYFVHSYVAEPARSEDRLAMTPYAGGEFCSALRSGNVHGCQFHPEKSGETGLWLMKNWLALN